MQSEPQFFNSFRTLPRAALRQDLGHRLFDRKRRDTTGVNTLPLEVLETLSVAGGEKLLLKSS
jgi:hypothetical protein